MAIKLYSDRIEIGNFTLTESGVTGAQPTGGNMLGGGLLFTGEVRAQFLTYPQQGTANGWANTQAPGTVNKYAFASDNGAVDAFTVTPTDTNSSAFCASVHSDTHGYRIGGENYITNMSKFPFSDASIRLVVGTLVTQTSRNPGTSSLTHGHSAGGTTPGGLTNTIHRVSFSYDQPTQTVGTLSTVLRDGTSFNSNVAGYRAGGYSGSLTPAYPNTTYKYLFASTRISTSVGDCATGFYEGSEQQSSKENGYYGEALNHKKFPFATDNNTTLLTAALTYPQRNSPGWSSLTAGYLAGGGFPYISNIVKFPFASDTTRTAAGNLTPTSTNFGYAVDSHSD